MRPVNPWLAEAGRRPGARLIWASTLGLAVLAAARLARMVLLYGLRLVLAPAETAGGLRQMVLNAAPLPEAAQDHPAPEAFPAAAPEVTPEAASVPGAVPEVTPRPALEA